MSLASMTGYARADGAADGFTWSWELRSVNGRGLDVRCRLPLGFDALERDVRAALAAKFARGNVSVNLTLARPNALPEPQINRVLLDQLLALTKDYPGGRAEAPRLDALLAIRGVVEVVEPKEDEATRQRLEAGLRSTLTDAIAALIDARRGEGGRLHEVIVGHLEDVVRFAAAARHEAAMQPQRLRERLLLQIRDLVAAEPALSEERLSQEVALLLVKADVREELDRIDSHVTHARELLSAGDGAGRKLDFLAQEFNREANTLCSKSSDIALTRIGLDLKTSIDRMREQVQNIE